ncbi:MAG: sigma-54-dependent Fis family transcriptional regulator [Flavobacteriales bacterium]|nr:sigma-54-dependent Fis family transcriptional regulator [Flavobacteriales bacterium]
MIIITGYSDIKAAVEVIKFGAFNYVTKPIYPEMILELINKAIEEKKTSNNEAGGVASKKSRSGINMNSTFRFIEGKGDAARKLSKDINLIATTDMSVVILGESGTGKEYVARMIHASSERHDKAFVTIDCGALPDEVAGSELFGHKKGAFTGAFMDKEGQFEVANKGTLFLDEIGNLSYDNQMKVLRAIQERKVRRIGDTQDIEVDIRLLVATNENLRNAVKDGKFREDLYFRLNEFTIEIPPLRDRKEDIMVYADHFRLLSNDSLRKNVSGFQADVIQKLKAYPWPGNLRELKNVVKRAILLCNTDEVHPGCLPEEICHPELLAISDAAGLTSEQITDLKSIVEAAEKEAILRVLKLNSYNKSRTAEQLGIDRKTLYNKMTGYGLLE